MISGKMAGTVSALMIADINRISQVFGGFKSGDMLEIHGFIDSFRSLYVYICGWELMLSGNKEKVAIHILFMINQEHL